MRGLNKPCLACGEVTPNASRCDDCEQINTYQRGKARDRKTFRENGYDTAWDRLSKRARKKQPFCLDCGTPDNLTADHKPQAWVKVEQGKALDLSDVDVVCSRCNSRRGSSRPGSERAQREQTQDNWTQSNDRRNATGSNNHT
ncbi:hypothetical protein GCM10027047_33180 [Rhodococcus aerolatus]